MNTAFENLKNFFDRIKHIGFWQRIFYWRSIKTLSYDAYNEFKELNTTIEQSKLELEQSKSRVATLEKEKEILESKNEGIQKLEFKITQLEEDKNHLIRNKVQLEKKVTQYEQTEDLRKKDYEKKIASIEAVRDGLEGDRTRLNDDRVQEKEEALQRMKELWKNHQDNVESTIRDVCKNNIIKYVEDVPFKGKPDNTIMIADEYIIFDAKSPSNEDLNNFPKYLKTQAESVKKYIKEEDVKKDIFLVIPSNTTSIVKNHFINMGDYNVYLVSVDSLEPIILSLKKIEEYEFAEQLTPEERDNICRVIGKFAHTTKRKIQIDYFFSQQFLEILTKCETDLPDDIMSSVIEFEKAEKLNPPQEKRSKQILTKDLIKDNEKLALLARAKLMGENDNK